MNKIARVLLFILTLTIYVTAIERAEAFWAVRGAHGGFAMGGMVRAPVVADRYYAGGCYRCAPLYAPGAVAAGAAIGAAAATAATRPPAAAPSEAPPPSGATAAAPSSPSSGAASSGSQPACLSSLSSDARQIYNAARSAGVSSANLRDVVTAQTRSLVMAGKIPQSTARTAAESAGQCLAQASK